MTPLLTAEQAAEYLGVGPRTLANWRVRGEGPAFYRRGRSIRYAQSDVEAWLAANLTHHTSTSDPGARLDEADRATGSQQ